MQSEPGYMRVRGHGSTSNNCTSEIRPLTYMPHASTAASVGRRKKRRPDTVWEYRQGWSGCTIAVVQCNTRWTDEAGPHLAPPQARANELVISTNFWPVLDLRISEAGPSHQPEKEQGEGQAELKSEVQCYNVCTTSQQRRL